MPPRVGRFVSVGDVLWLLSLLRWSWLLRLAGCSARLRNRLLEGVRDSCEEGPNTRICNAMEQDHVDLPPDRPEWWLVASHESDLGGTCAEVGELEGRVEVWVQAGGAGRPPVHRHDQLTLSFVRVTEI